MTFERDEATHLSLLELLRLQRGEAVERRAHLATCDVCRARLSEFDAIERADDDMAARVDGIMAALSEQPAAEGVDAQSWQARIRAFRSRRFWVLSSAVAAAALVLFALWRANSGIREHAFSRAPVVKTSSRARLVPNHFTTLPSEGFLELSSEFPGGLYFGPAEELAILFPREPSSEDPYVKGLIITNPSGAKIFLGRFYLGQSPLMWSTNSLHRDIELTAVLPGYMEAAFTINPARDGGGETVEVRLAPASRDSRQQR